MSPAPPPTAANDPLVRILRESCVHFSEQAHNAGLLAPLMLLIAEALARLFGRLEDIILLWRAGLIPVPTSHARRPARRGVRGKIRSGARHARVRRRTPAIRPPHIAARRFALWRGTATPEPIPPRRRIDRYPKPPKTAWK